MANHKIVLADLDEMVFETRERGYGAYELRKQYNKRLFTAAAIAFGFFLVALLLPWLLRKLGPEEVVPKVKIQSVAEVMALDIPEMEEFEPPPEIEIPKPKIKAIEFKVPEPKPDEEVIEEETIMEMDTIKEFENISTETVDSDIEGYDFSDLDDGDGDGVVAIEEPKEEIPDPNAFIPVEKEPSPVNMDNIKRLIGYPPTAKEAEIEGKVILRILVGKDGRYRQHIVIKNPHPILTKAVEGQVTNLQFTPGIQAGKPIPVWVTIPFDFKLLR